MHFGAKAKIKNVKKIQIQNQNEVRLTFFWWFFFMFCCKRKREGEGERFQLLGHKEFIFSVFLYLEYNSLASFPQIFSVRLFSLFFWL